jgi:peptide/nickel transport system ATP-binding protein
MLLSIEDLHIHFSTFEGIAKVLNGVTLSIGEGERIGLVGETGCGKSITLKALLRILPMPPGRIAQGRILFKGRDLLTIPDAELHTLRGRAIALIPQEPIGSLNPVFTIEEQMVELILWQGRANVSWAEYLTTPIIHRAERRAARAKALDLLAKVNIPDPERVLRSYPAELSGGMCQRVLIAMAIAGHPSLLVADEPGTALDVTTQAQILRLLKERVREEGMAILYVTHNLGVAREMSERIYVMYAGEVAEMAPTDLLFSSPKHPYTQGLLASIPRLTGGELEGIPGRIPDYVSPPPGCRFQPRCPWAMPVCATVRPDLRPLSEGHFVACHLYDSGLSRGRGNQA